MDYEISTVTIDDKSSLAELRMSSMNEGLKLVGCIDAAIARIEFLETFSPKNTRKILINGELAGFFTLKLADDHLFLEHLYFYPKYQSKGVGSAIISKIKILSHQHGLPVRLVALRMSRSNHFYKRNGFSATNIDRWNVYYEFSIKKYQ